MEIRNSIKQMLRTPVKSISFLLLLITACAFMTTGINLWVENQRSQKKFEKEFMTIGTVEQTASSVSQELLWNAESKKYEIYQSPEYTGIHSLSVLDFNGADYIQQPEKRSYYGSYGSDYVLREQDFSSEMMPMVVEFSPLEDCVPSESVRIRIKKVLDEREGMTGAELLYCDHYNETPEPLYKDRTYVAYIGHSSWAHGKNADEVSEGKKLEYTPMDPQITVYGKDGRRVEDPLGDLKSCYELTQDFYEKEIGKRYLEIAKETELFIKTFPVTGTNCTKLLMPFYEGDAYISEGSDISEEEYREGKRVCLISDTFANNNNLNVGDTVTTRLYYTNSADPASSNFALDGGCGYNFHILDQEGKVCSVFEEEKYKISGIYSTVPGAMDIGGNEMIVPINSIKNRDCCNIISYGSMNRKTTSFQIQNGTVENFIKKWEEQGIQDVEISFFDKGYSVLKNGIEKMKIMAVILGLIGLGMGLTLLFFIDFQYVWAQKKKIAIERSLGLSKRRCMVSLLSGIFLILITGCCIGGWAGFEISGKIPAVKSEEMIYDTTFSNGKNVGEEGEDLLEKGNTGANISVGCAGIMILAGMSILTQTAWGILKEEPMELLAGLKKE